MGAKRLQSGDGFLDIQFIRSDEPARIHFKDSSAQIAQLTGQFDRKIEIDAAKPSVRGIVTTTRRLFRGSCTRPFPCQTPAIPWRERPPALGQTATHTNSAWRTWTAMARSTSWWSRTIAGLRGSIFTAARPLGWTAKSCTFEYYSCAWLKQSTACARPYNSL